MNGRSSSHSRYWKHCSSSAKSKSRSRAPSLVEVVLEADDSPRACAARGEEAVEAQLVGAGEREAGGVRVAVDVVGLDAVEALAAAEVEPARR